MNTRKLERLRELMHAQHVDSVLLNRADNFAWLSDGAESHINIATDYGAAALLVTSGKRYVIANNIEAPRLQQSDTLADWEFVVGPWHEGQTRLVQKVAVGVLAADSPYPGAQDLADQIVPLRFRLDELEQERFRHVGAATGRAVQNAARAVKPGMSENQIAGLIVAHAYANEVTPIVVLVAADERVFKFRHPLPTERKLERYAMLVLCGRRWGLVASATRLIHRGKIADEVRRKADACAAVDAAFIRATQPGVTLADVFQIGVRAYAEHGFADEWRQHHQGGLAGYQPRERLATPTATERIEGNQAFAWNPSIAGTKSEDTILLSDKGTEIVSQVGDWPCTEVDGIRRPDILQWE
ncbi:MAG: M24 family metallopeptidase [Chloroflexi bacterium]|nr:MAG: M24 family metallopeptidase [Chloroflexota bacterium]